ncbi:MAG: aspartate ammonia-lyase [Vampirovibrio sp.]|nr:aspartate ammonia-lyase [Vampirovibrio sp.]
MATVMTDQQFRIEKDSIGEKQVPADAYYGVQALRGKENFPISGITPPQAYPEAIRAFGWIKKAAAKANKTLGLLDPLDKANNDAMGDAIMKACDEMIAGKYNEQFIVDVYQGGTGTSNHMNANEILANRATELMGGKLGEYKVNPNDHPNCGQSTNDVTPTVIRLTLLTLHGELVKSLNMMETGLRKKSEEFKDVLIPGRTHMQDAVPLTLGQQFGAYADAFHDARENVEHAVNRLHEIALGGNALGTGINTHPKYRDEVAKNLAEISGFPLRKARNYFQLTSSFGHFADYSSSLRSVAIELEKLAHDLKLYSSGPKTGIGEIALPSKQPGSSIMPGKVNPIYPELMDQISYIVQGNDMIVNLCCQNGQWQLNVMMPTILLKMTESVRIITNSFKVFTTECIDGLQANTDMTQHRLEHSNILLTALNPHIGYSKAAEVAKVVLKEGITVRQAVLNLGLKDHHGEVLDDAKLDQILSVENMTAPPKE